jgi:hypoxanthine phosphoribosyltransferase
VSNVLLSEEQIREQVCTLAGRLDEAYPQSEDLVLVGVLRGAIYFLSDLSRAMSTPHRLDFIEFASYRGTERGEDRIIKHCTDLCTDADVVLVDEVFDTGETIAKLREGILAHRPRSLATCVLLWKRGVSRRPPPEFFGFEVGPDFLVGYGLDHNQQLRHLPYVALL